MHTADITILGGLPVTVEFSVSGPDPDVGDPGGIDEWRITHINGKRCKKFPEWLHARVDKTKGENDRIVEKLNESDGDDYYDRADYLYEQAKDRRIHDVS